MDDLRIDDLAQRSGVTSRTIRVYQAKGLLPPPRLEGRTGYYSQEHLDRLRLIEQLQERGFSLAAIKATLDAWASGGDLGHLVGFENLIAAPFTEEQPRSVTAEELVAMFPDAADPAVLATALARAVELGLLTPTDDGFEAPSPLLVEAGAELAHVGVPLPAILDLVEAVRIDLADVADRFIGVVVEHVVAPLLERDEPDGDIELGEVVDTLKRLRPVALEVVRPFLAQELQRAVRQAVEDTAPT